MKRLIFAFALAATIIAPSVFAEEPKLPAYIGTWESYVLKCIPKPDVELTITVYTPKNATNHDIIKTFDKKEKRVAQLEFIPEETDAIKFTWLNKEEWVKQDFTLKKESGEKLVQAFETALGISMKEYSSCIK